MQRERVTTVNIDGRLELIPIAFYRGITLVGAKDFTPKAMRKGNYYVPVITETRKGLQYKKYMPVDKFNYMQQANRVSIIPVFNEAA